jgi:RNA polymerase sigma-70 factor (ECF subfamily)
MFGLKRKQTTLTDEELILLMAEGDATAFNQLYKRYNERLFYYFFRMLGNSTEKAEDFLQDIFVKVIDKANTFDCSRKFSTWIFSIAHNMCKNEYRRMDVRKDSDIESYTESIAETEIPDFELVQVDVNKFNSDLFAELELLDDMHKSVFLLHYREDFSLKDIALMLNISEGTVKSRLFYARKRLAEKLVKYKTLSI